MTKSEIKHFICELVREANKEYYGTQYFPHCGATLVDRELHDSYYVGGINFVIQSDYDIIYFPDNLEESYHNWIEKKYDKLCMDESCCIYVDNGKIIPWVEALQELTHEYEKYAEDHCIDDVWLDFE